MSFDWNAIKDMVRARRKAIAAAVAPVLSVWLLKVGFDVDSDTLVVLVSSAVTALTVHTIPNKAV